MRKGLLIGVLGLLLFGMSSCEQKTVYNGVEWYVDDVTVNQWEYSNTYDNNWFYAIINCPSITQYVLDQGTMETYLIDTRNGHEVQIKLPYSVHREEFIDDQRFFYTETYDCIYSLGTVELVYTVSDFAYEDSEVAYYKCQPTYHHFKVALQW